MAVGHFLAYATGAWPGTGAPGWVDAVAFAYITAHDALNASSVHNAETTLRIGQRTDYAPAPPYYHVRRGGLFFDTSYLAGMTLTGADLRFMECEPGGIVNNIAFDLCVVSGQDLQVPLVAADYGELLDDVTVFGSITIPIGGWGGIGVYQTINLNAGGLAQINQLGITNFGLRSLPDINVVPPPVTGGLSDREDLYVGAWNRFYDYVKTSPATDIQATSARLHGSIDEAGSSVYLVPDLVVSSDAPSDFSNCDFRFAWDEDGVFPYGNFTPWKTNQPWYTDINEVITDLKPGTKYWFQAQIRCNGIVETNGVVRRFTTSAGECSEPEDGYIALDGADWDTIHDAPSSPNIDDTGDAITIASVLDWGVFFVYRGFLYFDTSSIPPGATIISAFLSLMPTEFQEGDPGYATLHIVEGVQAMPLEPDDYGDHLSKIISGGSAVIGDWVVDEYTVIELNATGKSWIQKGGITKFCLRMAADINDTPPTGLNYVSIRSSEIGPGFCPALFVEYSLARRYYGNIHIDQLIYQHAERMK